jgi:hypothetical protein
VILSWELKSTIEPSTTLAAFDGGVVRSEPSDPIADTIRKQRHDQAMRDLPTYVARRWAQMPKAFTPAVALAWLRFQMLSETEQLAVFLDLYRRSTVQAIDRANQIAESQAAASASDTHTPVARSMREGQ